MATIDHTPQVTHDGWYNCQRWQVYGLLCQHGCAANQDANLKIERCVR